jgi:PKD repeat protein
MNTSVDRALGRRTTRPVRVVAALVAALLAMGTLLTQSVGAVQPGSHNGKLVSSTQAVGWTPHVLDGYVSAIAEVGDTVIVGGNFAQIATADDRETAIDRPYLFSFQKGTGQINTNFSPVVNGEITSIVPSGDGQTVFIGGGFNNLNGQTVRNVAKVDLATGQRVTQFANPVLNGQVNDLRLRNGKLYAMGRFTLAGSQPRPLLAAFDPITGALDADARADFTDPRRDSFLTIGTGDITADGTRMVVAGNFTKVNGQDRYQIAQLDLTTSPITVTDWSTNQYGDGCASAFATYMRDVDYSPDGSYFVAVTTGAYSTTYLCDTAARWETNATGSNLQPTWTNYTGGDTLLSAAVTDTAVYLGGHQRWSDNPFARDAVGPGAVTREGLGAVDPRNGTTLSWNPGRTRGVGVYTFLATDEGLWIGSDTDRIANFQYRGRIAFMPLDQTATMPVEYTGELPGQVVSFGRGAATDDVNIRDFDGGPVTTGGSSSPWTPANLPGGAAMWLDASDAGTFSFSGSGITEWRDRSGNGRDAEDGFSSSARPTRGDNLIGGLPAVSFDGSNDYLAFDGSSITNTDYTVAAVTARTSNKGTNYYLGGTQSSNNRNLHVGWRSNTAMTHAQYGNDMDANVAGYSAPQATLQVSRHSGTAGKAMYLDGTQASTNSSTTGLQGWSGAAVGRYNSSFFQGRVGEVLLVRSSLSDADRQRLEGYLAHKWGTTASLPAGHPYKTAAPTTITATPVPSTTAWNDSRGAFMVDGKLFTGWADGTMKVQDFDGATFGEQTDVSLIKVEGDVASRNRYATEDLPTVSGTFYDRSTGRMYFTRTNSSSLHSRGFSPESQIVGSARTSSAANAGGVAWNDVRSMFLVDGKLYTAMTSGDLVAHDWNSAAGLPVPGTATTVSGPGVDGQDWRARGAVVVAAGGTELPNEAPTASFSQNCAQATCEFDASASDDTDGTIESYTWNFGDDTSPGVGVTANHVYAASGTYPVTLTVTDDRGATTSTTQDVTVTTPNIAPTAGFAPSCAGLDCTFDSSPSIDQDGTIVSYSWTFGDGGTSTDASPQHSYDEAGTYDVSLTVVDDRGASNTRTTGVTVVDPDATATVSFRAAASVNSNSTSSTVTVPGAVRAGDVMVLFTTSASETAVLSAPAGWTLLDQEANATATVQTAAWTRTATAADAGSNVTLTSSRSAKMATQLVAYEGASTVSAHQVAIDTTSTNTRTTPTVNVTTQGSALISYWADKSADNGGWTLPAEVTLRDQSVGAGSGRVTAAVADSGPLGTGTTGGYTASSPTANRRGVVWSVVVSPGAGAPNVAPTASFTSNCAGLTCSFDAADSDDPDGTITGYSWNLGQGPGASGVTTSRTYSAAGTYDVSLTVTDNAGATNTTTRQVTVSEPTGGIVTFREATGTNVNSTSAPVTVPASVQAGDVMVIVATANNVTSTLNGPTGWTLVNSGSNATTDNQSRVWTRTATAADAGSVATVTSSSIAKMAVQLSAYSGAAGVAASAVAFDTVTRAERTTPVVPVTVAGSTLVSYWADKSSATTDWSVPASAQLRHLSVGSGGGRITAAIADTGSLAAGNAGGITATADSSNRRGLAWSIVIRPL